MTIFEDDADYAAFAKVMTQAAEQVPAMRLLGYCLMPNHWHLVLWPLGDVDLSEYMRWLTVTHSQRWHAHRHTAGTGPVYQGRFKSFPIETDEHLLTVLRYVERNALRARLVELAEEWRWGSLWRWGNRRHAHANAAWQPDMHQWPLQRPHHWCSLVNDALTEAERAVVRASVVRGTPYGKASWVQRTAERLGLESTLRPRGRPRKVSSAPRIE